MAGSSAEQKTPRNEGSEGLLGSFDKEIFKPRYQRNNKRGGLKNLRCFPSCGFRHKERGFCGRSVVAEVSRPKGESGNTLYCWAEFVKCGPPVGLKVGERSSLSELVKKERSKDEPTKPWVKGERLTEKCTDLVAVFEFNKDRRGWHYGWASNKHTCNAEHCLQGYVLQTVSPGSDEVVCRAVFQSPRFMLFCRRRRRFTMVPSAPVAAPLKRQRVIKDENSANEKLREESPGKKQRVAKTMRFGRSGKFKVGDVDVIRMDAIMRKLGSIMATMQNNDKDNLAQTNLSAEFDKDLNQTPNGDSEIFTGDTVDLLATMPDLLGDDSLAVFGDADLGDMKLGLDVDIKVERKPVENGRKEANSGVGNRSIGEQMLDDVAKYLLAETSFKRAVEELGSQSRTGSPDYPKFLRVAQEHLEAYRRSRNISIAEFDQVFAFKNQVSNSTDKTGRSVRTKDNLDPLDFVDSLDIGNSGNATNRGFLGSALNAITSLVSSGNDATQTQTEPAPASSLIDFGAPLAFEDTNIEDVFNTSDAESLPSHMEPVADGPQFFYATNSMRVPNISGQWRRTPESEMKMQEMRSKSGTPWVLSKMFEFMESRFEIEQRGLELLCRLKRKWISNTTLTFILDGEEHEWGIKLPAPFSQLSQGWTYRAWVDDNKIVLTHTIGDQRLVRVNWVNDSRSILYSTVILEVEDPDAHSFKELSRCNQEAVAERFISQI